MTIWPGKIKKGNKLCDFFGERRIAEIVSCHILLELWAYGASQVGGHQYDRALRFLVLGTLDCWALGLVSPRIQASPQTL